MLVGGRNAGLSPDTPVDIPMLAGLPLTIPPRPNAIRNTIEQRTAAQGIALTVAIAPDTLALCLAMCSREVGYSITPRCALISNPQFSDVTWAPIRGLDVTWSLFENPRRTHSQAVRKCRRLLTSLVNESIASGKWTGARQL